MQLRKAQSDDYWHVEHDPNLESLRDAPEFRALIARLKASATDTLERIPRAEARGWDQDFAVASKP